MTERRLRAGFAGLGRIAGTHANGMRLSGRWDIAATAPSSDPARAAEAGRAWGLAPDRVYADFNEMARAEAAREDGIDAVVIVTPNHLHGPAALAFMAHGIDVMSDKPLCMSLDEVAGLEAAHKKSGVIYGVSHVYACHAMARQAREMVKAGDIGEIRQVHVEYLQDWALEVTDQGGEAPWRLDPARTGDSFTVADIGVHAEHLLRFVTGLNTESLSARFFVSGAPKNLEDSAFMHLRMTGGVPAALNVSQAAAGEHCALRIRVYGSKAGLCWDQENPECLHFRPAGAPAQIITRGHGAGVHPDAERLVRMPRGHPEALTDAWGNLYQEFAEAVAARRGSGVPPQGLLSADLADGARGMRFVDAAVRSHRENRWVDV